VQDQQVSFLRWSDVAKLAFVEVAGASLGRETTIDETNTDPEPGHWGSVVSLVSGHNVTCVGISSTPEGCRMLAAAMLGMDATEAKDLSDADVHDSIGELANILAGVVKGRLSDEDSALTLGLPLFIDGLVEGDRRSRARHFACLVGDTRCVLTLLIGGENSVAA